eukprot:4637647-Pyramimonas_sp.AAC.1
MRPPKNDIDLWRGCDNLNCPGLSSACSGRISIGFQCGSKSLPLGTTRITIGRHAGHKMGQRGQ